jgi:hypothetical protein
MHGPEVFYGDILGAIFIDLRFRKGYTTAWWKHFSLMMIITDEPWKFAWNVCSELYSNPSER